MHPTTLTIATRTSRLALWQAEYVKARLLALYPECRVTLLLVTTRADQVLDRSLTKIGGKGLFVTGLETALRNGQADLAVHSLKDVPAQLDADFALAAILHRTDPCDAFVSNTCDSLQALPAGGIVGTSSLRREAQLRERFPHLVIRSLRGNLDTRLDKLDHGGYDGIILAASGLQRLGLQTRIRTVLPVEHSLPAAGQGALAIETLAARQDVQQYLTPLTCADTYACCTAERTATRLLDGSCQVPLAAYAKIDTGVLDLRALVALPDGSRVIRARRSGAPQHAADVGQSVAQDLLAAGAGALLASLTHV